MDWPHGVQVAGPDSQGAYMVGTPYHDSIVAWAKLQPIHSWDKAARVWRVVPVGKELERLHKLCWELWPDGQARPQQGAGYRRGTGYRRQNTANGTLLAGSCNVQGCHNPGTVHLASSRAPVLCTACLESLGRAILQHYGIVQPRPQVSPATMQPPVETPSPTVQAAPTAENPQQDASTMPCANDDALAALFS